MIKLFTHTDLDGIGCAILAKLAFGTEVVDIEYCNYDDIDSKVEEYFNSDSEYECHITDISISNELAYKISNSEKKYQLLDHHPTALRLNEFAWCNVQIENKETNIKTSGTEMYYHWLVNNNYLSKNCALDRFVELVRNYDTWRWTTLGDKGVICKQVNDLFYLYGREKFIDWCITEIYEDSFPYLYESDELVLEIEQNNIDNYIKKKNEQMLIMPLCGKTCGVVFAEKYFSELGNKLCQMRPEIDFVAMIDMSGTVSYRTIKDDIDLGKDVAKLFGGGGHAKAAGSRFVNGVQFDVINSIFKI
jgi:oligoribonuclease NrnB/cAMP/cGMP phosphodiesterase (DHH superfamily)